MIGFFISHVLIVSQLLLKEHNSLQTLFHELLFSFDNKHLH